MSNHDLHTYKPFNKELEHVRNQVLRMGGLVEHQILQAMNGWERADTEVLSTVFASDAEVNRLEVELDDLCRHIIARRQPIAGDLRVLTTVMKLTTDIERVGDEASKIARLAEKLILEGVDPVFKCAKLFEASELARLMLRDALDAYARLDSHSAGQVMAKDATVDALVQSVTMDVINIMEEHTRPVTPGVRVILIAKAIERIGDHAKNIAEDVIYMVKGKDVRHQNLDHVLSQAG
ncbi:MAG: phosphate signaling complex protein PhoU [Pseudomonadota bacterium]